VVIRLTRQQHVEVAPPYSSSSYSISLITGGGSDLMSWTNEAIGGVADPADPTNVDKVLITLTRGLHRVGVSSIYKDSGGTTFNFAGRSDMVIEVF
jgi:hypothetical protein